MVLPALSWAMSDKANPRHAEPLNPSRSALARTSAGADSRSRGEDRRDRPRLCRPAAGAGGGRRRLRRARLRHRPRKIEKLNAGQSYIRHISSDTIAALREGDRFEATDDFAVVREVDAILICVPTPLTRHREPDLSYRRRTAEAVAPHLRPGQLVVLESTTYPGTTEEVVKPILERSGCVGRDFFLAYSPEREDPGNVNFATGDDPQGGRRRRAGRAAPRRGALRPVRRCARCRSPRPTPPRRSS